MADCCFLAERQPVDADITSQLARPTWGRCVQAKELPTVVPPPRPRNGKDLGAGLLEG